ncbi:MAG: sugar ABC transporter permease [Spirochaetaceae bacterium]|nr:sugar ABC transporter permease [Spirochaetaceae bacterium]MDE0228660.1 sugar ABC transporter permease [Spirochaetaceae bacterium]
MIAGGRQLLGDRAFGIVLLIPALAIIVGIILFPLLDAARLSITSTNLINIRKQPFVGLRNYQQILTDPTYWQVVGNTFFITGASVAASVVIGMALALALNAMVTVRGLLRALFIVPWLVPGVVIGVTWNWMLSTETGIVNYIIRALGIASANLPWLADGTLSMAAVNGVFVWSSVPFIMVTLLGGLQAIPSELVEAAIVDGATFGQRFRKVVLPLLLPIVTIATILRVIYTMQNFVIVYMLTQGGPGFATETLALYVYETAFNSARLGKASAIGVTWFFYTLVFVVLYLKLVDREERQA